MNCLNKLTEVVMLLITKYIHVLTLKNLAYVDKSFYNFGLT